MNDPPSTRDILKRPYARLLTPAEDGTYTAEILEFSGCCAEGDTAEEAIANLEEAAASWIEAAIEQGQDIPSPIAAHGHSGKISLRLAKSIHKQAARFAERDGISLNQFFTTAIAARVGAEEFYEHLVQRLWVPYAFSVKLLEFHATSDVRLMSTAERPGITWQAQQTEDVVSTPSSLAADRVKVSPNG